MTGVQTCALPIFDASGQKLRKLNVASGALKATGDVDVSPRKELSGKIYADVGGSIAVATVPLNVSGTLKDPVLTPTGAAVAGAVAGAAVLGPVGSALGTKAGAFVDKLFSRKSDAK